MIHGVKRVLEPAKALATHSSFRILGRARVGFFATKPIIDAAGYDADVESTQSLKQESPLSVQLQSLTRIIEKHVLLAKALMHDTSTVSEVKAEATLAANYGALYAEQMMHVLEGPEAQQEEIDNNLLAEAFIYAVLVEKQFKTPECQNPKRLLIREHYARYLAPELAAGMLGFDDEGAQESCSIPQPDFDYFDGASANPR